MAFGEGVGVGGGGLPCLGQKDLLEEGMAVHSSIPSWRIQWTSVPWTEEPAGYSPEGHKELDMTEVTYHLSSPGGSVIKNSPVIQETWVRSLGQEDPLEKETATHSSTRTWKIPWREEPGRLQSMGLQRLSLSLMTSWVRACCCCCC